jgi:RHS repeat-associated protein
MHPLIFLKRKSKLATAFLLLVLGLTIWVVHPALGRNGVFTEQSTELSLNKAGPQTGANYPSLIASTADVTPEVLYYHQDATGNVAAMTGESSQVVWQANQRPFGQGSPSSTDRSLNFAGQAQDATSGGLYHLGARMYDPLTGRFLSPDPILLASVKREVPQRFNQYSYALNNPYRYHDASGLEGTEFTAQDAMKKFLRFYEAKLGPNPNFGERMAAFLYGPLPEPLTPSDVVVTNNEPIRNRAGQEVDLDWGARLAGYAVAQALYDQRHTLLGLNSAEIASRAKKAAVETYRPAKQFWNGVDWIAEQFGGRALTGPYRPNDPNIRGIELLVDYIVYGGDLRDYFDPAQVPAKR